MRYYEYMRERGREMDKQRFKVGDRVENLSSGYIKCKSGFDGEVDYGTVVAVVDEGYEGYEVLWDGCSKTYYCPDHTVIPSDEYSKASYPDNVNKPSHYNKHGVECIEAIRASLEDGFPDYCRGNVMKYLWRYKYKNGVEDLKKARVYLDWLIEATEGK